MGIHIRVAMTGEMLAGGDHPMLLGAPHKGSSHARRQLSVRISPRVSRSDSTEDLDATSVRT